MRKSRLSEEEILKIGRHFVDNKSTVRATGDALGFSKTTVHYVLTRYLKEYSSTLAKEAKEILDINSKERHIRGGMATAKKFLKG